MQSIFDVLHKNFQENQLNSRFPGGFLNSSRFPEVVDTLLQQVSSEQEMSPMNVTLQL